MRQRVIQLLAVLAIFLFIVDWVAFRGIRTLTAELDRPWRLGAHGLYWLLSIAVYAMLAWAALNFDRYRLPGQAPIFYTINAFLLMSLLPKLVFIAFYGLGSLWEGMLWAYGRVFGSPEPAGLGGALMSRGAFLTYATGAALSLLPLGALVYGMVRGRYAFKVFREELRFAGLPKAFDGLKVVQLSDMHLGSFEPGHPALAQAVKAVNDLQPDLILFTGDLVNNYAYEAQPWVEVIRQLKAPMGKFAVLGNHDYGDYGAWNNAQEKRKNFADIKQAYADMGFNLLLDEHRFLQRDGERIALIGIENWGQGFAQYGDLYKAFRGAERAPFKLLMSHDPSHWRAQVLPDTDIDLTLSGHTHGMQFGIEVGNFRWSPSQYRYAEWGGLYQEGAQRLYVNRGLGYHAYAGRVGISPEITLLTLRSEGV